MLDIRLTPPYIESISRERPKMLGVAETEIHRERRFSIMKKKPAKKKKK